MNLIRLCCLLVLGCVLFSAPAQAGSGLQDATQIVRNCLDVYKPVNEKITKCGAGIIVQFCVAFPLNYTFYQQSMCMLREQQAWQNIYAEDLKQFKSDARQHMLQLVEAHRKEACVPPLKRATNDLRLANYYKCRRDVTAQYVFKFYKSQDFQLRKSQ